VKKIYIPIMAAFALMLLVACGGDDESVYFDEHVYENGNGKSNSNNYDTEIWQSIWVVETDEEFLKTFDTVREFNYNEVRTLRDGLIGGFDGGKRLSIWMDFDVTDFSVIVVDRILVNEEEIFGSFGNLGTIAELEAGSVFLIDNYVISWGFPRSGISFIDPCGARRYYMLLQGINNNWRLDEFENRQQEFGEWRLSWWENAIEPSIAVPNSELREELLEKTGISEYGWQVAVDFLSGFDTLFEPVFNNAFGMQTGGSYWAFDRIRGREVITYDPPNIFFDFEVIGFLDRHKNRITDVPWIYVDNGWEFYAHSVRLYDFDGNGIPDIFVNFIAVQHVQQIGIYNIYRYMGGEYRLLEQRTVMLDGRVLPYVNIGHDFRVFTDDLGRLIAFSEPSFVFDGAYHHLVFDGEKAIFNRILEDTPNEGVAWEEYVEAWRIWFEHHWSVWEIVEEISLHAHVQTDSWLDHSPTIFGTDISLTLMHPFDELRDEMMVYLIYNR